MQSEYEKLTVQAHPQDFVDTTNECPVCTIRNIAIGNGYAYVQRDGCIACPQCGRISMPLKHSLLPGHLDALHAAPDYIKQLLIGLISSFVSKEARFRLAKIIMFDKQAGIARSYEPSHIISMEIVCGNDDGLPGAAVTLDYGPQQMLHARNPRKVGVEYSKSCFDFAGIIKVDAVHKAATLLAEQGFRLVYGPRPVSGTQQSRMEFLRGRFIGGTAVANRRGIRAVVTWCTVKKKK